MFALSSESAASEPVEGAGNGAAIGDTDCCAKIGERNEGSTVWLVRDPAQQGKAGWSKVR